MQVSIFLCVCVRVSSIKDAGESEKKYICVFVRVGKKLR